MTKHKKTRLLLVAAATGLSITTAAMWIYYSRVTVDSVQAMILKESPIGSRSDKVVAMLNSHRINGIYSNDSLDIPQELKEVAQGTLTAYIRDVRWSLLYRWDIRIQFYFDKHDNLIKYLVKEVGTGP
jgi:hypothetical protein